MIVLETERLYLRQWVPDDRVRFKPLLIDPRVTQYVLRRDWTDEKIGMTCDGMCDCEGFEVVRYVISNPRASHGPATKISGPMKKSEADVKPI